MACAILVGHVSSSSTLVTHLLPFAGLRQFAQVPLWRPIPQRLVGTHRVVDALPDPELSVDLRDGPREVPDLVELLRVGARSLGDRGGRTKRRMPRSWQTRSNCAWNSEPPSTWMARTGKGIRVWITSRKRAAAVAGAGVCTSRTSQRETTSRAVKRLRTTPGSGLRSSVST